MSFVLHRIENYHFGAPDNDEEEEEKPHVDRMEKIKEQFSVEGTVKSVRCIILVHEHNIPNILLLRNTKTKKTSMPGGKVKVGEDDETAIRRILNKKFAIDGEFDIGDHVATWYRPQFTEYLYPYLPAHITTAKEIEKWYVVMLPEKAALRVQSKHEPFALPFIQIHNNVEYEEQTILYIPAIMSKYDFVFAE